MFTHLSKLDQFFIHPITNMLLWKKTKLQGKMSIVLFYLQMQCLSQILYSVSPQKHVCTKTNIIQCIANQFLTEKILKIFYLVSLHIWFLEPSWKTTPHRYHAGMKHLRQVLQFYIVQ